MNLFDAHHLHYLFTLPKGNDIVAPFSFDNLVNSYKVVLSLDRLEARSAGCLGDNFP